MWEGGSLAVSHSESLDLSILHPGQQNFRNISQEARPDSPGPILEKEIPDSNPRSVPGWDTRLGWSDINQIFK